MAKLLNKLTDITSVEVNGWLYEAGRSTEDGTEIVGQYLFLIAETPDGFRFQHDARFCSDKVVYDEDGFNHLWSQTEKDERGAKALLAKVQARIAAGGRLDPEHWFPVQGCYGSAGCSFLVK